MSNKIDELCTVVLPTFFPGDEIFKNIKSIPSELNILIIDNSYNDNLKYNLNFVAVPIILLIVLYLFISIDLRTNLKKKNL